MTLKTVSSDNIIRIAMKKRNYKILVIDESVSFVLSMKHLLSHQEINVIPCLPHVATETIQTVYPDVILLSFCLKPGSSINLLARIKRNPEVKNIPVIIVSKTKGMIINQALEEGAFDFLVKPFTYNDIMETIYAALELSHQGKSSSSVSLKKLN